jgi:hypothetical protein
MTLKKNSWAWFKLMAGHVKLLEVNFARILLELLATQTFLLSNVLSERAESFLLSCIPLLFWDEIHKNFSRKLLKIFVTLVLKILIFLRLYVLFWNVYHWMLICFLPSMTNHTFSMPYWLLNNSKSFSKILRIFLEKFVVNFVPDSN